MTLRKKRLIIIVVCAILCICALMICYNIYVLKSVVWINGDVSSIERIELFSEQYGKKTLTSPQDIQKLIDLLNASKAKKIISYAREGDVDESSSPIDIHVYFFNGSSQRVWYSMFRESLQKSNFPDKPNLINSKRNMALEEYLTELLNITEPPYA